MFNTLCESTLSQWCSFVCVRFLKRVNTIGFSLTPSTQKYATIYFLWVKENTGVAEACATLILDLDLVVNCLHAPSGGAEEVTPLV